MATSGSASKRAVSTGNVPSLVSMPEPEGVFDRTLREIQQAISRRAYDMCQARGFYHGNDLDDWFRAESELFRFVPVEVIDDDNDVRVLADVPGFSAHHLTVQLDSNRLLIRGKLEQTHDQHRDNVTYTERQGREIFRVVYLPAEIETEKATATMHDGVLELTLPKTENSKSRRLQVKAA